MPACHQLVLKLQLQLINWMGAVFEGYWGDECLWLRIAIGQWSWKVHLPRCQQFSPNHCIMDHAWSMMPPVTPPSCQFFLLPSLPTATSLLYLAYDGRSINDDLIGFYAKLFSDNYGVWGAEGFKLGFLFYCIIPMRLTTIQVGGSRWLAASFIHSVLQSLTVLFFLFVMNVTWMLQVKMWARWTCLCYCLEVGIIQVVSVTNYWAAPYHWHLWHM